MIKDLQNKTDQLVRIINTRAHEINLRYRSGPDLYFYRKLIKLKKSAKNLIKFIHNEYNLEIVYATLVAWDMNSRGAKLKYFDDFKDSIFECQYEIDKLSKIKDVHSIEIESFVGLLTDTYKKLEIMKTSSKLVSNSKLLHFLVPDLLMPMDRQNTLTYFYGNTGESVWKYLEIIETSLKIMKMPINWNKYLDSEWNTTIPKIIDNAIILKVDKSVK